MNKFSQKLNDAVQKLIEEDEAISEKLLDDASSSEERVAIKIIFAARKSSTQSTLEACIDILNQEQE